jgi:hypothetical protein
MTSRPIRFDESHSNFAASGFRARRNAPLRPLAESRATKPTGHCQSRLLRTETSRARNAAASLTLYRAQLASVPKSAPAGGIPYAASASDLLPPQHRQRRPTRFPRAQSFSRWSARFIAMHSLRQLTDDAPCDPFDGTLKAPPVR